jgi:hypothetical protein
LHRKEDEVPSYGNSDSLDHMSENFRKAVEWTGPILEWQKILAQLSLNSQFSTFTSSIPVQNLSSSSIEEPYLGVTFTPATDPLIHLIVGYKTIISEICFTYHDVPIYEFNEHGKRVIQAKHGCDPKRIS